jgi:membrane protease YdiL (CAAX protease family)
MLDYPPRRREVVLLAVLFEGGLGVLALALAWLIGCPLGQSLSIDGRDILFGVAATLPLLLIFLLCLHWQIRPLVRIKAFAEEFIKPLFRPCTLFDLAAISLLAGLGEEMLFRGVLQEVLSRWLNLWLALTLASVLFGLLHLITPTYAVMATLMGAYLGWLYLRSGNLLVAVIAHALYDFFALAYLVRGRTNQDG